MIIKVPIYVDLDGESLSPENVDDIRSSLSFYVCTHLQENLEIPSDCFPDLGQVHIEWIQQDSLQARLQPQILSKELKKKSATLKKRASTRKTK